MSSSIPSIVNNTNSTLSPSIVNSSSSSTNNPQVALSNDVFGSVLRTTSNTTTSSSSSSTSSSSTTIPRSSIASSSSTSDDAILSDEVLNHLIGVLRTSVSMNIPKIPVLEGISRIPVDVIHSNGIPLEEMKSSTSIANVKVLGSIDFGYREGLEGDTAFGINNQLQLEKFSEEISFGKPKEWAEQFSTLANLEENNLVFLYMYRAYGSLVRSNCISTMMQTNQNLNLTLINIPGNYTRIWEYRDISATEFIILSIPKTNTIQKICLVFEDHKKDRLDMEYDAFEFRVSDEQITKIVERSRLEKKPQPEDSETLHIYFLGTIKSLPDRYRTWFASLNSEDQSKITERMEDNFTIEKMQRAINARNDSMRLTVL